MCGIGAARDVGTAPVPVGAGGDLGLWASTLPWRSMPDMGRPTTKAELAAAADREFDRLWAAVDAVPVGDRERAGACEAWSVKDLLAHLHAWQEMTLNWEQAGSAGEHPSIPAEGYTFAETPALNEAIHQRSMNDAWDDVVARLRVTHSELREERIRWVWRTRWNRVRVDSLVGTVLARLAGRFTSRPDRRSCRPTPLGAFVRRRLR
jgi:hypothetical protein